MTRNTIAYLLIVAIVIGTALPIILAIRQKRRKRNRPHSRLHIFDD